MANRVLSANLYRFWCWWRQGLLACLPTRWRERITRPACLTVELGDAELCLTAYGKEREPFRLARSEAVNGGTPALRHFLSRHRRLPCIALLSPRSILQREVRLPEAARNDLDQALAFEMDQLTPFTADHAGYDYRILDHQDNQLVIMLYAAPLRLIESSLSLLETIGLRPRQIAVQTDTDEAIPAINLLPRNRRQPARVNRFHGLLMAICSVLFLAWMYWPLWENQRRIHELEAAVHEQRNVIATLQSLEKRRDELLERAEWLQRQQAERTTQLRVLAELSRILPAHTWLQRLSVEADEVSLRGESRAASGLISILQESPLFTNARFRSPVTYNDQSQAEQFQISAQLLMSPEAS